MEVQIPVENISDKQIEMKNEIEQNQQVINNFLAFLHTGAKTNFLSRYYKEFDVWKCEFCEKCEIDCEFFW